MTIMQARLIFSSGFLFGGILLLSVRLCAWLWRDGQGNPFYSLKRYRTIHYLIYGLLLIIAGMVVLILANN